jgi:hypothetical protein
MKAEGSSVTNFNASQDMRYLEISDAAAVNLDANFGTLSTRTLNMDATATLDLTNGFLVVDWTTDPADPNAVKSKPLATVTALMTSGFNEYAWDGAGINSSIASDRAYNGDGLTALGVIDNQEWGYTVFGDKTLTTVDDYRQTLVRYTYYGDCDLSGTVDDTDLSQFLTGYYGGGTGWLYGDFNYDGMTDDTDLSLFLSSYYGQGGGPLSAELSALQAEMGQVPEPTTMVLLTLGGLALLRRRNRKA